MYIFIFNFLSIFILTFTTHKVLKHNEVQQAAVKGFAPLFTYKVLKPSRRCCSGAVCFTEYLNINLHSTMYLFQLQMIMNLNLSCCLFTFHYVSISTLLLRTVKVLRIVFTFHYVSISTRAQILKMQKIMHLHSTMYLFQLSIHFFIYLTSFLFTFHYVSISTPYSPNDG